LGTDVREEGKINENKIREHKLSEEEFHDTVKQNARIPEVL